MPRCVLKLLLVLASLAPALGARLWSQGALASEAAAAAEQKAVALAPRSGKGGQKAPAAAVTALAPAPTPRSGKGGQKAAPAPPPPQASVELVTSIRKRVRAAKDAKNLTELLPGFVKATARVTKLEEFARAKVIRVHLSKRTYALRLAALKAGKKVLVTMGSLGGFRLLDPAKLRPSEYVKAATPSYIKAFGEQLDVGSKIKVGLFVIESMAVDPASGCRVGPPGYTEELEYGMLRQMGAIGKKTPVVTMANTYQLLKGMVLGDGPLCAQVPATIICTPRRTTVVEGAVPKLKGVNWDRLGYTASYMRLLRRLRAKLQGKTPYPAETAPSRRSAGRRAKA